MPNETTPGDRQQVFVIEDCELLVKMYRSIFRDMGCEVIHASTKHEALRLLQQSDMDLIIVDDRLPDGTGLDATRAIRARDEFTHVPIIATVSQRSKEAMNRLQDAGIELVVTKPLQLDEFSTLARRCLVGSPPSAATAGRP